MDRLRAERIAAAVQTDVPFPGARPHAIGWATVELDRAEAELSVALGLPAGAFGEAASSAALGASGCIAVGVLPDGLSLVILEPSTEGRLAGTLARHGEGPAVVWYATGSAATGVGLATAQPGPFGPERLVADDPIHGPHRFLIVGVAGTIAS